ncbi:MAG: YSC84-related protein [Gammaproteobacteria bacterium]|nr:YSC84-related protein [Gammaproteobacteria bacterium]MDH5629409.1 YSC84-related protein [Gammaproteobacteria bacterium]
MKARLLVVLLICTFNIGCATISGNTPAEQKQSVNKMKNEVLTELFKVKPTTRSQVSNAPGYAVFSNVNVNVVFASFGGGYGYAKNNKTGKVYYMRMGELGFGLGLGAKDFRAVFVFHNRKTFDDFIKYGWSFGGNADAAAKLDEKGGAASAEGVLSDVTVYQFTKNGLALQATLKGTKYWLDEDLNK